MQQSILQDLLSVFGEENLRLIADVSKRTWGRAVERRKEQKVEIVFDDHGYTRHINGTDGVNGIKPKAYTPE